MAAERSLLRSTGALKAACAVLLAAGSAACEVHHQEVSRHYSEPLSAGARPGASAAGDGIMDVVIRFEAGSLRLGAASEPVLYTADLTYCDTHREPRVGLDDATDGGRALTIALEGKQGVLMGFGGERNFMTAELSPDVPVSLDLSLGPGDSVLDLSELDLRGLRLAAGAGDTSIVFGAPNRAGVDRIHLESTLGDIIVDALGNAAARQVTVRGGVGSIRLDMSGAWDRDAGVRIEGSVGDVHLVLPEGPGFRLEVGSPWAERVEAAWLVRREDAFYTEGYDQAGRRIDIVIEAGIGALGLDRAPREEETGR